MSNTEGLFTREIACQQILMEDSSVFSVQWTTVPSDLRPRLSAEFLLERYLAYIRRFTLTLIRPVVAADGIAFRLAGTGRSLILFTPPIRQEGPGHEALTLRICGGFLVQARQCDRGELSFMLDDDASGVRLTLRLTDYCPLLLGSSEPSRLRKWLYRFTQAYIHKVVTVRFLARVYADLAGSGGCVRVVRARVRDGEEL
ncbi:hypothetical protein [Geobacter anodireducens]|uniref:DUF2867 domain-containing protein n=1 Tax=Geobacter soli TaxID=1510391 RepID=A0A0C1TW97_9BACT|nr:hypothetical protein [Geobacter soli]ANA41496.1 hypothetical protein A2G06_16060 [Geobacter anodireducens]KIE43688.1 hypothetical protein SE37_14150 [Geobacter soli]HMN01668.1 hypothetical protein [Geobacter anodireducens]